MNKNRILIGLGIAIGALLLVFISFQKNKTPPASATKADAVFSKDGQRLQIAPAKPGDPAQPLIGFLEDVFEKYSWSRIVSEQTKRDFAKQAHLQMEFPEHFRFHDLDLEFPNITGIYAATANMHVTVLAGRILPSDDEIKSFLKAPDNGIPNTDGKSIALQGDPVVVAAPEGSGMKAGRYWAGRTADNESVRVGFVPRADGMGSYLFIFTGNEDKLDNSEDFFEELYKSLKALPE